jgi:hypothetical protein
MAVSKASQDFVPIKEIREGVLILKDGSMRAIVMTSSVNFALKSKDEQDAIIFQFQNFLNSLDFSIQIFAQSRKLDIKPYIALLEERQKEQLNDLMKIQTNEYIEFIKTFTEQSNIMTKSFFVVVPYTPPILKTSGKPNIFKKTSEKTTEKESFQEHLTQLEQRIGVVEQGLIRTGVRTIRLGTEELIEVFYKLFNPGDVERQIN